MAWAAPLAAVASIGGDLVSGAAQSNAADYQAKVASNNALEAGYNAAYSTQAGAVQGEQKSRQGAEKQAGVKAAMAANGVDVNSGSAVRVQEGGRELAQTDTANVVHNANLQAYGYRTQQTGYDAQSNLDQMQSSNDLIGSDLKAVGAGLGDAKQIGNGVSSVASLFAGG
jgi:hypothetical protein